MDDLRMKVGNVEIVALSDMNISYPMPLEELWSEVPSEDWGPFRERYPDTFDGDRMRLEIGCYLVRSQGRTILIDTGYGPGPIEHVGGLRGRLMADLAQWNVDPQQVDTVFLSHLHADHIGWNMVDDGGRMVPTFPNARYVAHKDDLAHFREPHVKAAGRFPYLEWYVEPLVDLGLFDAITGDLDLTGEVKAVHTPGHTPGHMSVVIASGSQRAIIEGDVLVHPAQVTEEGWNSHFDADHELSTKTRSKLLNQVEADGAAVIACHFPKPGFGHVVRYEGKRYWQVGVQSVER